MIRTSLSKTKYVCHINMGPVLILMTTRANTPMDMVRKFSTVVVFAGQTLLKTSATTQQLSVLDQTIISDLMKSRYKFVFGRNIEISI